MSGKSKAKRKKTYSSRGISQRIVDGRIKKTKKAPLKCSVCGRFFENLGQVNQHYKAARHKRKVSPPKRVKFSKDISQADLDQALAFIELLKNPMAFREKIREHLEKKRYRDARR
jgi:hypothetical protein